MKLSSTPASLAEIWADPDEFGLLENVAPLQEKSAKSLPAAAQNFLEIVEFVEKTGREPEAGAAGAQSREHLLAVRLAAYRASDELAEKARIYDRPGLLGSGERPATLEDIFASDCLGLLDEIEPAIFAGPCAAQRRLPDEIATRKPCADFAAFEGFFRNVHALLKRGDAVASRYRSRHGAAVGSVFVLRGLLCHVAEIVDDTDSANHRLRVIFENATEVDLLKNSLVRALFRDGAAKFVDLSPRLTVGGEISGAPCGHIYILESLSDNPALARFKNAGELVKIGWCSRELGERIKNAENDPTFLEAPVVPRATLDCFNLDPRRFESLIHSFLHGRRLCVELRDKSGAAYRPREWFTVNWRVAAEICRHIVMGDIGEWRLDNANGRLVRR